MWSRWEVKAYARKFLKRHYLKAFLVCIIVWALGSGITSNTHWEKPKHEQRHTILENDKVILGLRNPIFNFGLKKIGLSYNFKVSKKMIPMISIITFALTVFVGNVAEVGKVRFFLNAFKNDDADTIDVFTAFNSEQYIDIVKTQFYRGFFNFLWTLLFIIPGIIKSYEYRMVPYIISKEPNMAPSEAIRRSRFITEGHKWKMFVLDLSFLGWNILGSLFFGVGSVFVIPYEEASFARLYNIISGEDDNEIDAEYEISGY